MTIRFIKQWNGHSPDEVNSSLGSSEESRLVLLGYASYDLDGANDGTESLVKAKINPLTGGSDFLSEVSTLKLPAGITDLSGGVGGWSSQVYDVKSYGLAADGVTDDTQKFKDLLDLVYAAGGGTILVTGMVLINSDQITFPNNGAGYPTQPPIRITGKSTSTADGVWRSSPISAATIGFDLRYNAATAKFITLGAGMLEIDHLTIKNGGSDTAPFFFTTHTTLNVHDIAMSGSANMNDGFVFGSTGTINNTITSAFQGYNTIIQNVFFDRISKGGIFNGAANGIRFVDNVVSLTCDGKETTAVTAATNSNPCVLTIPNHGWHTSDKIRVNMSGFTGSWVALNGSSVLLTVIDGNTVSVAVDSTSFGAMAGSPSFLSGSFLDFNGSASYNTIGCKVSGNLVEMNKYAYFARMKLSEGHVFMANLLFDSAEGRTIAYYKAESTAVGGVIIAGYQSNGVPSIVGAGNTGNSAVLVIDSRQTNTTYGVGTKFPHKTNFLSGITVGAGDIDISSRIIGTNAGSPLTWAGTSSWGGAMTMTGGDFTLASGGQLIWNGKSKIYSASNGYVTMWNTAQSGFTGLKFGTTGSTAGFPMLKVNGGGLTFIQADETTASDIYVTGKLTCKPGASVTPANNGDLTFEATSNTSVTVKLKGSDGTVRSTVLTLA